MQKRIRGLDGLRCVAVLVVFISHYMPVVLPSHPNLRQIFPGMLGVSLFFSISGFLITSLLISEMRAHGKVSLRNFYFRRFLRLSPALYVYIALVVMFYFCVDGSIRWGDILSAVTYTSNYYQINYNTNLYYMPLWSLAIEEHFYLVFPACFAVFMSISSRATAAFIIVSILIVSLWRLNIALTPGVDWHHIYWRTDTRIDTILFGCLLAIIHEMYRNSNIVRFFRHWTVFLFALTLIAISTAYRDAIFRMSLRYTMQGISLSLITFYIATSRDAVAVFLQRLLSWKPMVFIGSISYSLYLWHLTLLKGVERIMIVTPSVGLFVAVASVLVAVLSYYFIEIPFLGLRRRFGSESVAGKD